MSFSTAAPSTVSPTTGSPRERLVAPTVSVSAVPGGRGSTVVVFRHVPDLPERQVAWNGLHAGGAVFLRCHPAADVLPTCHGITAQQLPTCSGALGDRQRRRDFHCAGHTVLRHQRCPGIVAGLRQHADLRRNRAG